MSMIARLAFLTTAALAAFAPSVFAAPLAYESFNYSPNTNLFGGGVNGGTGFSGGWQAGFGTQGYLNEVRTPGLSYSGHLASAGNRATLSAQEGLDLFPGSGNINYMSRPLNVAGAFGSYSDGTNIGQDGTTVWGSFLYNGPNDAAQRPLQFRLNRNVNALAYALPGGGATSSLVVFRVDFGIGNADTARFYVNPTLTFNPTTAVPTQTFLGNLSFNNIEFQIATRSGVQYNGSDIDEIRFGSTAADVVPVPEPGTFGLLGTAVVGLLARRARRA